MEQTDGTASTTQRVAEGRVSNLEKLVTLIQKEPQGRTDFECSEFIPLLRKHIEWFSGINSELIKRIIKCCKFLRCPPETVFIKQGDIGDSMYAILQGVVSVHVIFDNENERECLAKVDSAMAKKKFNKNDFGNEVAQKFGGSCIGEVALVSENCMRTATCITVSTCDFLVIDRDLYSVSVKEYIEKEYQDKEQFVSRNPLFRTWTPRQRNQLVISMKKQKMTYGDRLVRQGQELDGIYFIFKGDMAIQLDSKAYHKQFRQLWDEMKVLLPDMVSEPRPVYQAPHLLRKERLAGHKPQQICFLGENETIGSLEVLLGLDSYIETATAPGECELLVLKRSQFERMFKRKYAVITVEKLKESLSHKLCLYIYQSDPKKVAFLKYLNMKLMDANVLQEVRRSKHARARHGANIGQERSSRGSDEQEVSVVLKRLHMNTDSAGQLPAEDMSEVVLAKMDRRLRLWSENTNMNGSKLASLQGSSIILNVNSNFD